MGPLIGLGHIATVSAALLEGQCKARCGPRPRQAANTAGPLCETTSLTQPGLQFGPHTAQPRHALRRQLRLAAVAQMTTQHCALTQTAGTHAPLAAGAKHACNGEGGVCVCKWFILC